MKGGWAILLLAGCAGASVEPGPALLRDPSVPIASKVDFDPARFVGTWHETEALPAPVDCFAARVEIAPGDRPGTLEERRSCDGREVSRSPLTHTGMGRLSGPGGGAAEWVLWVDEGYRTAVLGRPDGRGARILDREPGGAPDRARAARTVMEFNGYRPAAR